MVYTVHGILSARILEWVAFPFPGDLPNPGIEPRPPALQVDSLPAEPQGKPYFSERESGTQKVCVFRILYIGKANPKLVDSFISNITY